MEADPTLGVNFSDPATLALCGFGGLFLIIAFLLSKAIRHNRNED